VRPEARVGCGFACWQRCACAGVAPRLREDHLALSHLALSHLAFSHLAPGVAPRLREDRVRRTQRLPARAAPACDQSTADSPCSSTQHGYAWCAHSGRAPLSKRTNGKRGFACGRARAARSTGAPAPSARPSPALDRAGVTARPVQCSHRPPYRGRRNDALHVTVPTRPSGSVCLLFTRPTGTARRGAQLAQERLALRCAARRHLAVRRRRLMAREPRQGRAGKAML
jgi:hypothetical protein